MYGLLEPTKRNVINAIVSAALTVAFFAGVITWSVMTSNPCSVNQSSFGCEQWMRDNPQSPETREYCKDRPLASMCNKPVGRPEYLNSGWQGLSGKDR